MVGVTKHQKNKLCQSFLTLFQDIFEYFWKVHYWSDWK